jgi:hypothetical protein
MTYRSTFRALLRGAAFFPVAPAFAQDVGPQPPADQPQAGSPTVASTAQPAEEEPDEDGEPIIVTGSRPRGSVVGDIPPEKTFNAGDVRATGATNINELLAALAPEIGSARGRGGGQPVLLLNGQRISGFRELRDIPTEAIQRVEILPEEVALKYGYRADQRVVNIVLRQRFRSTVAQAGTTVATDGGRVGGTGDLTRLMIQRNGRTTLNAHAESTGMLTEAERNIRLEAPPTGATTDQALAARSLLPSRRLVRGAATFNRQILGDVSATLNTELEHNEGRSLIGLGETLFEPLGRNTTSDSAHAGLAVNGQKSNWRWSVTGNADLARDLTQTERDNATFRRDRALETRASGDLTGTANGTLFALPAGNATTTLRAGVSGVHLEGEARNRGVTTENSIGRAAGTAAINVDLPVSRRGRDFSALGNLTLNANAEVEQLSDFGTLTTIGAGANWSPVNRLNLITSWTREEGAPGIQQLGDPVLTTPGTRIFDFTTGETALVQATTGGNPDLLADRRNVLKIGGNWQPVESLDLRLRADYVHERIENPVSNISVTPAIEAAFPGRFVRQPAVGVTPGRLISVDLRPVNFDHSERDTLRFGFDFTKPLKSRRPSQALLDQMRAQLGFGARGPQGGEPGRNPGAEQGRRPDGGKASGEGRRGGGFGGRGGGGGGFGGGNRGRLQFSLTDTVTFLDKVTIAPGLELNYLRGDAGGSGGGTPRHRVEAQAGYFNNGLGARLSANWRSGTSVNTLRGDDLRFSPLATFDLRLFANPGDVPELVVKHPWLRGTQVRFEVNNIFNTRPRVRSAAGDLPLNYQPDLLDPLGRTIGISIRKLFLPPPSFFRQRFQRERRQPGTTTTR